MADFVSAHLTADYASEVGSTIGSACSRDSLGSSERRRLPPPPRASNVPSANWPGVSGLLGLDAYSRHKKFINDYVISYGKDRVTRYIQSPAVGKTDIEILRENHRLASLRIWCEIFILKCLSFFEGLFGAKPTMTHQTGRHGWPKNTTTSFSRSTALPT
jgi:hypothetical protein